MAKISIEFDTVSKKMELTFDGQSVDNVVGVDISRSFMAGDGDGDEYCCCITTREKSDEEDHTVMTQILAAQSDAFKVSRGEVETKAHRDIQQFFSGGQ